MNIFSSIKEIEIHAKVIRKNGIVEDLGIISKTTSRKTLFKKIVEIIMRGFAACREAAIKQLQK